MDVFNPAGRCRTDRDRSALSLEEEGSGPVDLGAGNNVECLGWSELVAHGYAKGSKIWPCTMELFWVGRTFCPLRSGLYRGFAGRRIDKFSPKARMAG